LLYTVHPHVLRKCFRTKMATASLKDRKTIAELILALLGLLLITQTAIIGSPILAWIGVWLVLGTLFWHWYRIRKKARKQGKEVFRLELFHAVLKSRTKGYFVYYLSGG